MCRNDRVAGWSRWLRGVGQKPLQLEVFLFLLPGLVVLPLLLAADTGAVGAVRAVPFAVELRFEVAVYEFGVDFGQASDATGDDFAAGRLDVERLYAICR